MNAEHGRPIGDAVLRALAKMLRSADERHVLFALDELTSYVDITVTGQEVAASQQAVEARPNASTASAADRGAIAMASRQR